MKSVIQLLKEYREQMGRNLKSNNRASFIDTLRRVDPQTWDKLSNMTLSEFSNHDIMLKIRSRLLADDFYLVSNEVLMQEIADELAVYLPEEMRWLITMSDEDKKLIHRLKKELGGTFDCIN